MPASSSAIDARGPTARSARRPHSWTTASADGAPAGRRGRARRRSAATAAHTSDQQQAGDPDVDRSQQPRRERAARARALTPLAREQAVVQRRRRVNSSASTTSGGPAAPAAAAERMRTRTTRRRTRATPTNSAPPRPDEHARSPDRGITITSCHQPPRSRVVITGIGVVSPFGVGRERFWEHVSRGCSGTRAITEFDASEFGVPRRGAGAAA